MVDIFGSTEYNALMRKTRKELQILAIETSGYKFTSNPNWPKRDYALAILGVYPFSGKPTILSQEEKENALREMHAQVVPNIIPFPVGSSLFQITRGKNKGKFGVSGMYVQNSLKRFANIPIFVIRGEKMRDERNCPRVFTTREEAQEYAIEYGYYVEEVVLTESQIVR